MKGLLVFLLLISFVVNANLKCKPNEALDEQTQQCVKFCEIGEVYNQASSSCESTCPEGKKFNSVTLQC